MTETPKQERTQAAGAASDCNELLALGQTIYSLNIGNAARWVEQRLTPMKITKIGRKYFWATPLDENGEVRGYGTVKFYIAGLKQVTDYCADHLLYLTPQEWEDEKEEAQLCREIADAFEHGRNLRSLPLISLRLIAAQVRPNA